MGDIQIRSYSQLKQIVLDDPDTYTVIVQSSDPVMKTDYLEYQLGNGALTFSITGIDDQVTMINGEVDLSKLELSKPIQIYAMLDNALKPLCERRDILAAEISVLKIIRHVNFLNYNEDLSYSAMVDQTTVTIERPQFSTIVSFSISLPV